MHSNTVQCGVVSGRLLRPLLAVAATTALALATGAHASAAPPAATSYRLIPLSPVSGNADINAAGQVAFAEFLGGVARAKFYDGRVVRDIGTLGGAAATAAAINDAGQITGLSSTRTEGESRAYRWSRATGMIGLAPPGMEYSAGADINNKGWVTGTAVFSGRSHAFRWTPATGMVDLGSLNMFSIGRALNDAGTVVGDSESFNGGLGWLAVRWPKTSPIPLTTSATPFSLAADINSAGQIVGNGSISPDFEEIPFLWSPQTGITDLGVRSAQLVTADKINEKGLVMGNTFSPDDVRGYVWTRDTGPVIFGTIGVDSTNTADLNNLGQVVGGFNGRAYVWTRAEGIVDLNTRIANAPPDLVLRQGVAISDNGSIVAAGNTGLVLLVPRGGGYHEAPVVAPIKMTGTPRLGALLSFSAGFKDVDLRESHTAVWSWGDGSKNAGTVSEKNGAGSVSGQHAWRAAGIYTVRLTVTDSSGKSSTVQRTVVVCASGAAMIAGEGSFSSPRGASTPASPGTGIAQFAFLSEANGKVAVQFDVSGMAFRSTTINSVRLGAARVQFSGTGTVNGRSGYRFTLGASAGSGARDGRHRFGIRISHLDPVTKAEVVDYDNRAANSEGSAVNAAGTMLIGAQ